MRSVLDAGFVFWGLFLVFAAIIVGYVLWMRRTERGGETSAPPQFEADPDGFAQSGAGSEVPPSEEAP